jgi:hypothetical protein
MSGEWGDWIEHNGREGCPIEGVGKHEVKFRDGDTTIDFSPETWRWTDTKSSFDIVAYRIPRDPSEQSERESVPEVQPTKHSHYHQDVSHLSSIDVYRIIDLYKVTDPCFQHAIKKLLVTGERGHKSIEEDVQNIIDTLERWKEMRKEDDL